MSKDLIATVSKLSEEQLNGMVVKAFELDIFDKVFKAGDYDGKAFATEMRYQGFDPKTIIAMVLSTAGYKEEDVYLMIQLCIGKGNNIDAMIKSSTNVTKKKLEDLKKKYYLVNSGKKSRFAMILPRIALVFPHITCSYAKISPDATVSSDRMNQISANYPKAMMCSAFAGLIPASADAMAVILKNAFMLWQYEFDSVINTKVYAKSRPKKEDILSELSKYLEAAISGSLVSVDDKIDHLIKLNIITMKNGKMAIYQRVNHASDSWLKFVNSNALSPQLSQTNFQEEAAGEITIVDDYD